MIDRCPICESERRVLVAVFKHPPERELRSLFPDGRYSRRLWQCRNCNHFYNDHNIPTDYSGGYVNAHYKDEEGLKREYERIMALPAHQSDNYFRVQRVSYGLVDRGYPLNPTILDVGAGLGVFVSGMDKGGWHCTALDPDPRAAAHLSQDLNIKTYCADWHNIEPFGKFSVVTHIKTLEHILDPIPYLQRTHEFLQPGGIVYCEVPSGELAIKEGPERQEFFYEHWHIFSLTSLSVMATKAGFWAEEARQIVEPSTKRTIYAFLRKT